MQNTPTGAVHTVPQRNQRIVALDGLRALAIAGVVLYHLRPSRLTGGFLGVTLFFTLSGYLATKSIMRPRHATDSRTRAISAAALHA